MIQRKRSESELQTIKLQQNQLLQCSGSKMLRETRIAMLARRLNKAGFSHVLLGTKVNPALLIICHLLNVTAPRRFTGPVVGHKVETKPWKICWRAAHARQKHTIALLLKHRCLRLGCPFEVQQLPSSLTAIDCSGGCGECHSAVHRSWRTDEVFVSCVTSEIAGWV
jgi:hypothetical protein